MDSKFPTMITISLLLWKGAYPYVHIFMNIWMLQKNSMKHHYFNKKIFFSHFNMEDITDADYTHTKIV